MVDRREEVVVLAPVRGIAFSGAVIDLGTSPKAVLALFDHAIFLAMAMPVTAVSASAAIDPHQIVRGGGAGTASAIQIQGDRG